MDCLIQRNMSKYKSSATARVHAVMGQFSVSGGPHEGPGGLNSCAYAYALPKIVHVAANNLDSSSTSKNFLSAAYRFLTSATTFLLLISTLSLPKVH